MSEIVYQQLRLSIDAEEACGVFLPCPVDESCIVKEDDQCSGGEETEETEGNENDSTKRDSKQKMPRKSGWLQKSNAKPGKQVRQFIRSLSFRFMINYCIAIGFSLINKFEKEKENYK